MSTIEESILQPIIREIQSLGRHNIFRSGERLFEVHAELVTRAQQVSLLYNDILDLERQHEIGFRENRKLFMTHAAVSEKLWAAIDSGSTELGGLKDAYQDLGVEMIRQANLIEERHNREFLMIESYYHVAWRVILIIRYINKIVLGDKRIKPIAEPPGIVRVRNNLLIHPENEKFNPRFLTSINLSMGSGEGFRLKPTFNGDMSKDLDQGFHINTAEFIDFVSKWTPLISKHFEENSI